MLLEKKKTHKKKICSFSLQTAHEMYSLLHSDSHLPLWTDFWSPVKTNLVTPGERSKYTTTQMRAPLSGFLKKKKKHHHHHHKQ